jgi:dienelactone hydrolase
LIALFYGPTLFAQLKQKLIKIFLLLFLQKKQCLPYVFFLLLLSPGLACAQLRVTIAEPDGTQLTAKLFLPAAQTAPAIVALHGCAGPWPKRDDHWARLLAAQGHAVLLPDSFGSRALPSQCKAVAHAASAYTTRRGDAIAAAIWLQRQPGTPPGGIDLLGWSDGATTVLTTAANPPPGLFRRAIAFYPACTRLARTPTWHAGIPLLILIGAADDWTPPAPCQALAARDPASQIELFPGAYHDFDVPHDPVHLITGLPYTKNGPGPAHAGENAAARARVVPIVLGYFSK